MTSLTAPRRVCLHSYFPTAHSLSVPGQRPDQEDPHRSHGDGPDAGAREGPRDAGGPAVQAGQVLRQHAGAQTNVARQHGLGYT